MLKTAMSDSGETPLPTVIVRPNFEVAEILSRLGVFAASSGVVKFNFGSGLSPQPSSRTYPVFILVAGAADADVIFLSQSDKP
jgi:hypothetical protein